MGKRGRPDAGTQLANRKSCEEAFNKGWGVLFAASMLKLNKQTVVNYYDEFRTKFLQVSGNKFMDQQRMAKEHAINALDFEIAELDDLINDKENGFYRRYLDDSENPAWGTLLKSAMELRSSLKQTKFALSMTPTMDVSIETIIMETQGEKTRLVAESRTLSTK